VGHASRYYISGTADQAGEDAWRALTTALAGWQTEKAQAEYSAIHFTICPQATEIEYPHSGIFYSQVLVPPRPQPDS
jgi:hypothetical protein